MAKSKVRAFNRIFVLKEFQPAEITKKNQLILKDGAHEELGEIIGEIFYTPRGWRVELHFLSPLDIWDIDHVQQLLGIKSDCLEGDIFNKNFNNESAAMKFVTKRLQSLGWEAIDTWQ